jgi:hypothetical protein
MPACAGDESRRSALGKPRSGTQERIDLYSPRVRRSTIMYLRLRLLELREAGLDRARAAIEHRLSIDDMLAEPAAPRSSAPLRSRTELRPAPSEKANGRIRRTVGP